MAAHHRTRDVIHSGTALSVRRRISACGPSAQFVANCGQVRAGVLPCRLACGYSDCRDSHLALVARSREP